MGYLHIDDGVERALIALNDALCTWERATSRECCLMLIPIEGDEPIQVSLSGKPYPPDVTPVEVLGMVLAQRRRTQ